MPAAINPIVNQRAIAQYLQGVSRGATAADNGAVSNFIDEWKKGVQDSDYESIRELSVFYIAVITTAQRYWVHLRRSTMLEN